MISGLVLALGAAIGFGVVDLSTAFISRRIGTPLAVAALTGAGALLLLPVSIVTGDLFTLDPPFVALLIGYGAVFAVAYLALVQSLRLGPIAVIGPIESSIGAMTALLAIVVVGDRPTGWQIAGIGTAAVGSWFAAVAPGTSWRSTRIVGPGVAYAALNVVAGAILVLSLRELTARSWAAPLLVLRTSSTAWLLVVSLIAGWRVSRLRPPGPVRRRWFAFAIVIGLLDTIGMVALSISFREAPAWLVGLTAGFAPAIVTVGGVLLLDERLGRLQAVGVGLLGVSLVILALTG